MNRLCTGFLLLSIALSNCRSAQNNDDDYSALQALADETLGTPNIIVLNTSKNFALCRQKPGSDHARRKYQYLVVRIKDLAIIRKGSFSMGYVRWASDTSIEEFSQPETGRKQDGTTKIIDVNSPVE